jgi:hypothetical protein
MRCHVVLGRDSAAKMHIFSTFNTNSGQRPNGFLFSVALEASHPKVGHFCGEFGLGYGRNSEKYRFRQVNPDPKSVRRNEL